MEAARTVNIAIFGCGRQGKVHVEIIPSLGGYAILHSVYDPVRPAAEALSSSHPHHPRVAPSIESILSDPTVDAVIIVTPNATHADLVLQAASAGKHCLVEKPLDSDLGKIEQLRVALGQLAETGPLPYLAIGFPKRHDPSYVAMRQAIQSGDLGELENLVLHSRDLVPKPAEYMKTSGGMVICTCIHEFDVTRTMLGPEDPPASVFAFGSTLINPEACEAANDMDRVTVIIKTKRGKLATVMNARRCSMGNDQRAEAHCALGDVYVDNQPRGNVTTRTATERSSAIAPPICGPTAERYATAFTAQLRELVAAAQGGRTAPASQNGATVEDGYWASKLAAAATIALREGRAVEIR